LGYLTVKEKSLIYNPQTSFPNNEPTDVELGIKPKSTKMNHHGINKGIMAWCSNGSILF